MVFHEETSHRVIAAAHPALSDQVSGRARCQDAELKIIGSHTADHCLPAPSPVQSPQVFDEAIPIGAYHPHSVVSTSKSLGPDDDIEANIRRGGCSWRSPFFNRDLEGLGVVANDHTRVVLYYVPTRLADESPLWGQRLILEIDAADGRAVALVQTLSPQQLNWTPGPGVWSVGQCIEHLCVANEVYLPRMDEALSGSHRSVAQEITPGWLGRWFIRQYIEPSSKPTRRRAPGKIEPGTTVDPSVLDRFLRSNRELRAFIHRASNYDVNRIRFRNPFVPVVRFTVGTGLEILSKHERRHLLQAERIRDKLMSRTTPKEKDASR
jgi:hypothetical protein